MNAKACSDLAQWWCQVFLGLFVAITWMGTAGRAAPPESASLAVDDPSTVPQLLAQACLRCHGPDERAGGLLLTTRASALLPSDSGRHAIAPGEPDASELLRRVRSQNEDDRMPPDGPPLADDQLALIERWIADGAPWPTAAEPRHWAYEPPKRAPLPAVRQTDWPRQPLDFFVLHRLEQAGLAPSPPATPGRLLRRVYLDLIGLPPSPQALQRWLAHPTDNHFEMIVDELLAHPAYGEKWARHWLDLARYSDSNGYQADQLRDMWAYRDWVIQAMNRDVPYDDFSIAQLAGDLLPSATLADQIASGFHRATTCNVEAGVDPEANRTDQVIDRVNTTATVWLGTTLECAQCHNHKFDPFSQQDYYQLFSFFNNTPLEVKLQSGVQYDFWGPTLTVPPDPTDERRQAVWQDELQRARTERDAIDAQLTGQFEAWVISLDESRVASLPGPVRQAFKVPADERTESETETLREHFLRRNPAYRQASARVTHCEAQVERFAARSTLVMVEMESPRPTQVFLRGNYQSPGPSVKAATPGALPAWPAHLPRNRLGLARWLFLPEQPLTSRVAVNRWWAELFGNGLVRTPEDFGTQGEAPTHPELLDYLAVELQTTAHWSMKRFIRSIVLSSTYRQSARLTPELARRDPENRWLARMSRRRLTAEAIRDQGLVVSGLFVDHQGGPPVFPPQPPGLWKQTGRNEPVYNVAADADRYRRGVYVIWRRAAPYPSFVNFDGPDRASCVVRRSKSNTPLQALTLLNDQAYHEMSLAFAARVLRETPHSKLEQRITHAFHIALARNPSWDELSFLKELYAVERARLESDPEILDRLTTQTAPGIVAPLDIPRIEWATWYSLASVLLNLDETITRG